MSPGFSQSSSKFQNLRGEEAQNFPMSLKFYKELQAYMGGELVISLNPRAFIKGEGCIQRHAPRDCVLDPNAWAEARNFSKS